jgi:hypothetical protein
MAHASRVPAPALVGVTSPHDEQEHLVDEVAFVAERAGRWRAVCGEWVVSTSLACAPARRCPRCEGAASANPHHHSRPLFGRTR